MNTLRYCFVLILLLLVVGSCDTGVVTPTGTTTGTAGSLTRFVISDNYLYTVDNTTLRIFTIVNDSALLVHSMTVGSGIETIFIRENVLFLGSRTGVKIFSITNRQQPEYLSTYEHIVSCDPVVADARYAYSTLRTSSEFCNRGTNVLDIIDISNLHSPSRVFSIPMTSPKGLGLVDDSLLVVCDDGLKLINVSNRMKPVLLHTYPSGPMVDIIPFKSGCVALSSTGILNFSIEHDSLHLLGSLQYR
ncbi:MAG: hypothetical protein U0264_00985 [Candidatus Kapaibacterium sp.]